MSQFLGFQQQSIITHLGRMVYYIADEMFQPESFSDPSIQTLVFLHGFGGGSSAYEWSQVFPAFASRYRVFAPDLIGWGQSDHPARDYQIEDYLTTIREFIERVSAGPVVAIASSLTAAFVIRIAVEHPHLFKSLILTTPSGLSDFGRDYRQSLFAQVVKTPILDRALYSFGIATPQGIRSFLEQRQFAHPERISPEIVDAYLESARQPNAEYSALSFVRGDLCFDLSLYIPQLTVPTAMIWGEASEFTGPELGQRFQAQNPEVIREFIVLPNVGLTPQLELPAVTTGLISKLLKTLA